MSDTISASSSSEEQVVVARTIASIFLIFEFYRKIIDGHPFNFFNTLPGSLVEEVLACNYCNCIELRHFALTKTL